MLDSQWPCVKPGDLPRVRVRRVCVYAPVPEGTGERKLHGPTPAAGRTDVRRLNGRSAMCSSLPRAMGARLTRLGAAVVDQAQPHPKPSANIRVLPAIGLAI